MPSKIIYCTRSGLPLAEINTICTHGWPFLSSFQSTLIHPIYSFPLEKLLLKLENSLRELEKKEWKADGPAEQQELSLTMSAILYSIDSIWTPLSSERSYAPSLPSYPIAIGTGARLLTHASWYWHLTSKRLALPIFRPNHADKNTHWENFSAYLEACESVREEWEKGRKKYETEEERKRKLDAVREVRAANIYKRIDFIKVWNWIDAQVSTSPKYPSGRRETFKALFLSGDMNPEEWIADDIDDLSEAVFDLCDQGNEITHFIRTRLNHIRDTINSFYGSFTLLSSVASENNTEGTASPTETLTNQEQEFFESFDEKVMNLEALPPPPKRESFATLALFLKAQAQHNILSRRFNLLRARKAQ
jgi:hypothetical protein